MPEIPLVKGSGRWFGTTPLGKVFEADGLDWNKPVYVTMADDTLKSAKGDSLKGTLWFCNAKTQLQHKTV